MCGLAYWMSSFAIPLDSIFGSFETTKIYLSFAHAKSNNRIFISDTCRSWTVNALIIHNTKLLILIVPSTHISIFYCKIFIFAVRTRVWNIHCGALARSFYFFHLPFSIQLSHCALWPVGEEHFLSLPPVTSHARLPLTLPRSTRPTRKHPMCVYVRNFIHLTFSRKNYSDIHHLMCVRQVVNPSKSRQDTTPTHRIKKIKGIGRKEEE